MTAVDSPQINAMPRIGDHAPQFRATTTQGPMFIIDPAGVIRTIVYYPLSTGRNIPELLRVVKALQTADKFTVATPADWQPGEPVIVPPAGSCGTAKERMEPATDGTIRCEDWFFCQQDLDEDTIDAAIRAGER